MTNDYISEKKCDNELAELVKERLSMLKDRRAHKAARLLSYFGYSNQEIAALFYCTVELIDEFIKED